MATGADWMSAASFIGMAGTLYLTGFGGLAFVMGWTGGYCLVALFLAPYLRKFGQFTIPDFLGARFGGHIPRSVGIFAAILCSFTYVVAQIYGVGLITTRLTGVPFEIGIFLGLGGILVCSFLGGMRAVTWTQVAQYIILIIAYMIPVIWLSVKQTGIPIPQIVYGKQLEKVTALEEKFLKDPKELEVRGIFKARADEASANLKGLPGYVRRRQGEARRRRREAQGGQRAGRPDRRRRKGGGRVSEGRRGREGAVDEGRRSRGPRRAAAAARRGLSRQGRRRARRVAPQLPGARVLPDGRHRRAAAHPDALLHDAIGAPGARVGVLVAVLHLPAVLHRARARRAGEVRRLLLRRRLRVREAAAVGGRMGGGGSDAAVDRRRQQGRHRATGRDRDRRRHHRAGHAGDRGPAVRGFGPRGRGRPGCGAVHRGRPAADDRQRAVARLLLQDARSERVHGPPRDDLEDPAPRRGVDRGVGGGAETGGHPVPGVGGILARGGGVLPGAGAAASSGSARTGGARRSA